MRVAIVLLLAAAEIAAQPAALPFGAGALGAPAYPQELQGRLAAAWRNRPDGYQPRTRHLTDDGLPRYTNRLLLESSPYLLQHAHNPVDWRPWGDEAFEAARALGRPVLLSIGYSTCHWCHVMEEESFEDEEIARFLNENYIAIKVDREQRPDIDAVYMAAVQAIGGQGGWPMTIWLGPDRRPFYAATYLPPRDGDRGVRAGFLTVLRKMHEVYRDQPELVTNNAAAVAERVEALLGAVSAGERAGESALAAAAAEYQQRFDREQGGLQGDQKFPSDLPVRWLLEEYAATGDGALLEMASATLTAMARGGLRDHVHGGFHRYTTDPRWRVPHFEKMLYDNALLALAYIEGWRATGAPEYERTVRDILRFVSTEMTAPGGGFYSATDADSIRPETGEREEGAYFTWTKAEIVAALGERDAPLAFAIWDVTAEGDLDGANVLRRETPVAEIASRFEMTEDAVEAKRDQFVQELRQAASSRPKPLRDEKILAAWNGFMIAAYAEAAFAFDEPAYATAARRAAHFVLDEMRVDGRLQRSFFRGALSGEGYLDDYAAMIAGLLSLYEATGEIEWLEEAIALNQVLDEHFRHPAGGYYLTAVDHEELIVRQQPGWDGAEPSGNSVQAMNLLRLHELTSDDRYRVAADRLLAQFSGTLERRPTDLAEMLRALRWRLSKPKQAVFVAPSREEARRLALEMRALHSPHRVIVTAAESEIEGLGEIIPLLAGKRAIGGRATAYICEERVCKLPTSDPAQLRELLAK